MRMLQINSTHSSVDLINYHQFHFPKDPTDPKLREFLDSIDDGNLFGTIFWGNTFSMDEYRYVF